MVTRRLSSLGMLCAAVVGSGVLAGCGSSQSTQGVSNLVPTTGGIPTSPGTSNNTVAAGPAPQQVQVTVNGTTATATLPAGLSLTAGESVDVIPAGTTPINGLTYAPSYRKPAGVTVKPGQGQGAIIIGTTDTGLFIDMSGSLSGILVLPPGQYTAYLRGPFNITTTASPNMLTINDEIILTFEVDDNGVASLPTSMTLNLPGNGGVLTDGPYAMVQYPLPDYATGTVTLDLTGLNTYPSSITASQWQGLVNGAATIKGHHSGDTIPQKGLEDVSVVYSR